MASEKETYQELKFISRLGRWMPYLSITRRDLLIGYLAGSARRSDWQGINKGQAIRAAQIALAECPNVEGGGAFARSRRTQG